MISGVDKIVYILSDQRSGSTVADAFIGYHLGAFSAGEVINFHHYWQRSGSGPGSTRDWICRCGNRLTECSFWREVVRTYQADGPSSRGLVFDLGDNKSLAAHVSVNIPHKSVSKRGKSTSVEHLKRFYSAIADVSGKRVIVDSSKSLLQLDNMIRDPELRAITNVVILTRDARAVCRSVVKRAEASGIARSSAKSYVRWLVIYLSALTLLSGRREIRTLHVRYEDICDQPTKVIGALKDSFSLSSEECAGGYAKTQRHNIGGTPRAIKDIQGFRKDESWKLDRTFGNRVWYILAWPLNRFFGYR